MEYSNNMRKLVKSLDERRHRLETGLFKIEGTKSVCDTISRFNCECLLATARWIEANPELAGRAVSVTTRDMERMSSMVTAPGVISVCRIPQHDFDPSAAGDNLVVALDSIRDPGNLGTIIRVADWFGIRDIICSEDTTDCWAPKVIQATMGSIARVRVHYVDLPEVLRAIEAPVYGTFLDGSDIFDDTTLSDRGVIVIGNESHGISDAVGATVSRRITIPPYPAGAETGESLNAAVAAAITISTFRRKLKK